MKNSQIATTQLSLPKGGGAIQGIGETFQANEFTGTSALSIPIPTTPCRDFEPQLSVEYSSGSGNGTFGLGFSLVIPNVSRKTSKAIPKYDETDTFLLFNAEDLVPIPGEHRIVTRENIEYTVICYQPRIEGLFAKIERWTTQTGDFWRTIGKDNITSIFGKTDNARICDPDDSSRVFQWLLEKTFDVKGNYIVYQYKSENNENVTNAISEENRTQTANKYIERIKYGNDRPRLEGQDVTQVSWHFEVVFDYGEYEIDSSNSTPYTPVRQWENRQDPFSTYHAGFEIRTHRLCRNILMFHRFEAELGNNPVLVHATRFQYEETPTMTLLKAVESIGYRYEQEKYETKSLPPVEFDYSAFAPEGQNFEPLLPENGQQLPGLNLPPDYMSIDLYGEGIPGVLYSDGTTTLYWEPEGNGNGTTGGVNYASPKQLLNFPIERHLQDADRTLMDLAGDGRMALVVSTPGASGYYQYDPDRDIWQSFQPFAGFPTDFHNPNNQMVDVTGDGLMDILLVESDRLRIYPNQGEKGYGTPLRCKRQNDVPTVKQGALEESLHFTDIFGTGKQHLVRITNGSVECWPNLGYGRFGKKIQLANAPRFDERMDASRLFLVDIDGSGTADIAYVSSDRIQIWFNHSGNCFSEPQTVYLPSRWDSLNQINFADILGNGTTCLVFSENHPQPRHWCYDFCDKQKPYLLNLVDNNLGAISKITYASSTQFYLQDKRNGTPWITKLPFPVHVVEKVESIDGISNTKLVSSYSYHHGYYDRLEREFRGFGRVERQDAETLSTNAQPTDLPPVLTKTWYHTGAWQREVSLNQQYAKEYFSGDNLAVKLPDPTFDWGSSNPTDEEKRQGYVALKGTVLRSEVYGLDNSELAKNPYSVSESSYNIKLLQPQGKNQHAVFYVWERETLSYDYERNPQDPRISHHLTLEIDEFGHVLRDCAIAYGRRQITGKELIEQSGLKATYTENTFANQPQDQVWLLGIPTESKGYELKNISLPPGKNYFDFQAIADFIKPENLNLLGWEKHLYWDESQQNILPLGGVSSQALLACSKVAVVSQQQIESVFDGVLSKAELDDYLKNKGKYDFDSGYWWNPGLTQSYLGSDRFYLPGTTTDPFCGKTQVEYDQYCLLPVKVTDALGNETTVENKDIDYHTLKPQKIKDLNGNFSEVKFDALGMVILSSHYGTENGKEVGFAKNLSQIDLPKEFKMEEAIANPQTYLKGAASYFYYDLFAYTNATKTAQDPKKIIPVYAVNLVAENYGSNPRVQTHITYSDGFGREVQSKMRVEPDESNYSSISGQKINSSSKVQSQKPNLIAGFKMAIGQVNQKLCEFVRGVKPEKESQLNSDGRLPEKTNQRWLSSGGKFYNNKGNPIQEFEPYYIDTYEYVDHPTLNKLGVSSLLHYDPLQRVVRVDTPKGFFTKIEFTPWEEKHYDENDTVTDSCYYQDNINNPNLPAAERQALVNAAKFYDTPDIKILDNLGRTVQDVQLLEDKTRLVTRYELDIVGNQLSSADPRWGDKGLKNFQTIYDLTKVALKTVSADGGTHWILHNVMGNPIYIRDSRNFETTTEYDALHRPIEVRAKGGDGAALDNIVERIVYGESFPNNNAKNYNQRGQVYQHYDSAGLVKINGYNINGQPLDSQRQIRTAYKEEANWAVQNPNGLLQTTIYKTSTRYDAIGRVIEQTDSDNSSSIARSSVRRPTYNLSGSLVNLQVTYNGEPQSTTDSYVKSIDYNPKGQRTQIVYGNGVTTSYEYEATTFRLTRILTKRENKSLQDLNYTYDPVGNITQIVDNTWTTVFNNNQKVNPVSTYTYDALYRLVAATGREHPALSGQQEQHSDVPEGAFVTSQSLNNTQAIVGYTRQYSYDSAGNLYRIQHQGTNSHTRNLTVSEASNRAVDSNLLNPYSPQTTAPAKDIDPFFDANGNQIQMQGIQRLQWNYRDNIASVTIIERPNGRNDAEYYVYDSSGSRVRKVTERYINNSTIAKIEETIYLGGVEIRQTRSGESVIEKRYCWRVMDDKTCIVIRNRWTDGTPPRGTINPQVRYQLDNHLGSATMEVGDKGQMISYEEYYPYGGTAFVAGKSLAEVKLKHYRYSGKERDAVTGLYYYGARYYAPWLGRWMSCDPAGTVDGLNLYAFVGGNPVKLVDPNGMMPVSPAALNIYKNDYQNIAFLDRVASSILAIIYTSHHNDRSLYFTEVESKTEADKQNIAKKGGNKELLEFSIANQAYQKEKDSKKIGNFEAELKPKLKQMIDSDPNVLIHPFEKSSSNINYQTVATALDDNKLYFAINYKRSKNKSLDNQDPQNRITGLKPFSEHDYSGFNEIDQDVLDNIKEYLKSELKDEKVNQINEIVFIATELTPSTISEAAAPHAEMQLLNYFQTQKTNLPKNFGVSKGCCTRCATQLQNCQISFATQLNNQVRNWTDPAQLKTVVKNTTILT